MTNTDFRKVPRITRSDSYLLDKSGTVNDVLKGHSHTLNHAIGNVFTVNANGMGIRVAIAYCHIKDVDPGVFLRRNSLIGVHKVD